MMHPDDVYDLPTVERPTVMHGELWDRDTSRYVLHCWINEPRPNKHDPQAWILVEWTT